MMDEKDRKCRDRMLCCLGDLMEDTTDFSWGSAKSAHVVLMCEMQRGLIQTELTEFAGFMPNAILSIQNKVGQKALVGVGALGFVKPFKQFFVNETKIMR